MKVKRKAGKEKARSSGMDDRRFRGGKVKNFRRVTQRQARKGVKRSRFYLRLIPHRHQPTQFRWTVLLT
jgi:hypothetical protein